MRVFPNATAVALLAVLVSAPVAAAGDPCPTKGTMAANAADRQATREIERRIASDDTVAPLADRVTVTTAEGVVTLRGAIASDEDRMVLASLAESAPGVRRVEDRLEVQPWPAPPSASRAR